MSSTTRKRGPPAALSIATLPKITQVVPVAGESSAIEEDSDYSPGNPQLSSRSHRNMNKLSLTLPSARSSSSSLVDLPAPIQQLPERRRRPSVISLPGNSTAASNALLHRKEEEGEPAVPYADGPIQIIPSIWLGSEENARDWNGLMERGIKAILNVAKEVASPFDTALVRRPLRSASTPNLHEPPSSDSTYYPPHPASGRPGMHYLKLQWSHGQQDLVENGFPQAMAFTDAAVERGDGVLIHCQCGISRSATMAIALVMRAAAERSPSVPSEIWALKGMQGAYTFVKEKSKWVGPNMSLIYQLLEYERKLNGSHGSPSASEHSSSVVDEEEEWGRRRKLLDEAPSDNEDDRHSTVVMEEAKALDKAMEERFVARKNSASSVASSGVGMGPAWRSRFITRKRTGSIASNKTNGSILSEDLVEEDEERELLGIGGGFESDITGGSTSAESDLLSITTSPEDEGQAQPIRRPMASMALPNGPAFLRPPPSAPIWKTSFTIPPPPSTAIRPTFNLSSGPTPKAKRRPVTLGILPPVPSSPIHIIVDGDESDDAAPLHENKKSQQFIPRPRTESRKPAPPPLHLRNSVLKKANKVQQTVLSVSTPSQTLFVFPPSPTLTTRTPSTMTLTSNITTPVPFPSMTPRVSTFRGQGRTRSFIGLGVPPTPTTAFSKVDVRGYVGLE